jgi:hypothetical protein
LLLTACPNSVSDIAHADLTALNEAIGDEKAAKALKTACKISIGPSVKKRAAPETHSGPESKRKKSAYELDGQPQTPQSLEASLALPEPSTDEEEISKTVILTNRAPLVLAFAVSLLKYTMPEQPLSSRLSLAQAVVSANSRSKAVSIGIESGPSAEQDGWGQGQPKVRIMGRDVYVLKRGGYNWKVAEEVETKHDSMQSKNDAPTDSTSGLLHDIESSKVGVGCPVASTVHTSHWAASEKVTLKKSTFVARCIGIESSAQARRLFRELLDSSAELQNASHNITAWRVPKGDHGVAEECNDDGETGGGRHILQVLQAMDLVGVMVVVTRWYGGIMLGPDRWKLMSQVCRDALSQRLRVSNLSGQEALWGLDLEAMRSSNAPAVGGAAAGMPIHEPDAARSYIMKAFPSSASGSPPAAKKPTGAALEREKERNLGLLRGALDILFASWVAHVSRDELDRRAWSWYVQVRPQVEAGAAGWGGKGEVRLGEILNLRRRG